MTKRLFVIGSGTPWDGTRLADRHVAENLAAHFVVLFVDPPTSFRDSRNDSRLSGYAGPALQPVAEGIWRLTPKVTPRNWYPVVRLLTQGLVNRALRHAVEHIGLPVAGVLSTNDVVLGILDGPQAFWARDDYTAGASLMGLSRSALEGKQERAAQRADVAIAVTPRLRTKWEALGVPATVVPNGVDPDLFIPTAPRPADAPSCTPLVGFTGTLSHRIDINLLHLIVDAGLDLMLIGFPQTTMSRGVIGDLLERDGVHYLGHRAYEELPGYVQAMDVGLVPYVDSDFNRASFPLKTLEYLASGVPVVATDLPAIAQLDTELVVTASTDAFVEAVRTQARERHDPQLISARQEFA